jgi:hypothetical protein
MGLPIRGRPKDLGPCPTCGALLGAREREWGSHECPKQFAKPIGRPRKSEPPLVRYYHDGKLCAAPGTPAALEKEAYLRTKKERQQLVEFISAWRASHGKGESARILSNRSVTQLHKMKEQIERGDSYRTGRRWKQA